MKRKTVNIDGVECDAATIEKHAKDCQRLTGWLPISGQFGWIKCAAILIEKLDVAEAVIAAIKADLSPMLNQRRCCMCGSQDTRKIKSAESAGRKA